MTAYERISLVKFRIRWRRKNMKRAHKEFGIIMKIHSVEEFVEICERDEWPRDPHPYQVEASDDLWLRIIEEQPDLRKAVACNKLISEKIIRFLAEDDDSSVRWTIATKRRTPPDVLAHLANDLDEGVRERVACNPKVTEEILIGLLDDEWDELRETAQKKLKKLRKRKDTPKQ
jgi:hypothetical protein